MSEKNSNANISELFKNAGFCRIYKGSVDFDKIVFFIDIITCFGPQQRGGKARGKAKKSAEKAICGAACNKKSGGALCTV